MPRPMTLWNLCQVLAWCGLTWSAANTISFATDPAPAGFVSLFDGRTLAGWTGALDAYAVENGTIVCRKGTAGNLLTEKEYADFVLRFEFQLTAGANNGLGIRCPLRAQGNLHLEGTELQILDHTDPKYATIKPYQFHGSVYGIQPAKRDFLKPVGEWTQQEVTVQGRRIKVVLNGETIVDVDLDQATEKGTLDGAAHPGLARATGHLGFLGHGDVVAFRSIFIKDLSVGQGKASSRHRAANHRVAACRWPDAEKWRRLPGPPRLSPVSQSVSGPG